MSNPVEPSVEDMREAVHVVRATYAEACQAGADSEIELVADLKGESLFGPPSWVLHVTGTLDRSARECLLALVEEHLRESAAPTVVFETPSVDIDSTREAAARQNASLD
jgi:hypothetical protein